MRRKRWRNRRKSENGDGRDEENDAFDEVGMGEGGDGWMEGRGRRRAGGGGVHGEEI